MEFMRNSILFGLVCILSLEGVNGLNSNRVMPWMCLERCGGNVSTITENLLQLVSSSSLFSLLPLLHFFFSHHSTSSLIVLLLLLLPHLLLLL
jgi:hypothetical protein